MKTAQDCLQIVSLTGSSLLKKGEELLLTMWMIYYQWTLSDFALAILRVRSDNKMAHLISRNCLISHIKVDAFISYIHQRLFIFSLSVSVICVQYRDIMCIVQRHHMYSIETSCVLIQISSDITRILFLKSSSQTWQNLSLF